MLDPILLKTFLLIAQGNSFSEASRKLSLRQSTVSDQVRRLEDSIGQKLFVRDTHSVILTAEGEALVGFARTILEVNDRAERFYAGSTLRGRVRLGVSEDLVVGWLSSVLRTFTASNPEVDIELTVALSATLIARYDAGELDIVLCKRWAGDVRGQLVWRDEVVWIGASAVPPREVRLILYPAPSITRSMVLDALEHSRIAWRIVYTSDALNGLIAATKLGLGVSVCARSLIPLGCVEIEPSPMFPRLGDIEFILLRNVKTIGAPAAELSAVILEKSATSNRL